MQNWNKIRTLTLSLLAALLLAGCSDSQEPDQPEPDILSRFNANGQAWLNLAIATDSKAMTRASDDNGQFEVGEESENAIKDAYLFLFSGTNESDAKFASAYNATIRKDEVSSSGQVSRTLVISNANISPGDNVYAFVLLNNNDGAIKSTLLKSAATEVMFHDGTTIKGGETSFNTFKGIKIKSLHDASNYFLMTSAPMANKPGGTKNPGGATISTLRQLKATAFYPTEKEAEDHPIGNIVVERAAAKVSVVFDGEFEKIIQSKTNDTDKPWLDISKTSDIKWKLDCINTESYLARNVSQSWPALNTKPGDTSAYKDETTYYRFIEETPVDNTDEKQYRTYWAEDFNYDYDSGAVLQSYESDFDINDTYYIHENTIDQDNMLRDRSTALLIRLQLNGGNDFYTFSEDNVDGGVYKYQYLEQLPEHVIQEDGTSANSSFARANTASTRSTQRIPDDIDSRLRKYLFDHVSATGEVKAWLEKYALNNAKDSAYINFRFNWPTGGGRLVFSTEKKTADNDKHIGYFWVEQWARRSSSAADATAKSEFIDTSTGAMKEIKTIFKDTYLNFYDKGYCYYRQPIMHFGNELTPWSSGDYTEKDHLGRFGVVRNNHYTVTIKGFDYIGKPRPEWTMYKYKEEDGKPLSDDDYDK